MKVRDAMTPNFDFVKPDDTIRRAAEKMRELNVGAMPVRNGDEVLGILTDRDVAVRAVAEGMDVNAARVDEVMTRGFVACLEEDGIETAARLMKEKQIRRILVQNEDGKIAGIVSLGDVAVAAGNDLSGEVLEKVSEPSEPDR